MLVASAFALRWASTLSRESYMGTHGVCMGASSPSITRTLRGCSAHLPAAARAYASRVPAAMGVRPCCRLSRMERYGSQYASVSNGMVAAAGSSGRLAMGCQITLDCDVMGSCGDMGRPSTCAS